MTTISVCIIAKDEENYISDCIKSVLFIADEIILLDTGSADKTIEIASSFDKVKIFQTEWENDFSKARNECISYAKCNWILILDADERINQYSQNNLKKFIGKNHKDNSIFRFKTINKFDSHIKSYYKATLFKNNQNILYDRPVHEYPCIKNKSINIVNCEQFIIEHVEKLDSQIQLQTKARKYIEIMLNYLKLSSIVDFFYCKHLGDAYLTLGNNEIALDYYIKSENILSLVPNKDLDFYKSLILKLLKLLVSYKNDYVKALSYSDKALKIFPDCEDIIFYKAFCCNRISEHRKSIKYHQRLLKNQSNIILLFNVFIELSRAYRAINDSNQSFKYLEKARSINPDNHGLKIHYLKHYFLENNLIESVKYYSYLSQKSNILNPKDEIYSFLVSQKGWDNHEIKSIQNTYKNRL